MSAEQEAFCREDERRADQLSRAANHEEAVQIAVNAVEASLKALQLTADPGQKGVYRKRAQRLMQEAEVIKHSKEWKSAIQREPASSSILSSGSPAPRASKGRLLNEPVNSRELSKKERVMILKAGFLNGNAFPEWQQAPAASEFDVKADGKLFFDETSELSLSDFQHNVLDDWKRPAQALPPPTWFSGPRENLGPVMVSSYRDIDLVQDAATDCSVVASLCAGIARGTRGHPSMMHKVFFPSDVDTGKPCFSNNGRYVARLNFNGCYRKVVIDDRIPVSTTKKIIHVIDRNNPGLLWPALLEKAYLKVRGGYDFPGSNSATDVWILTGWIPEQVFLQQDNDLDKLWARMFNAFSYGDILITMGTGKMSSATERAIGLASDHDYAVLDLREVDGQRLMLIKNPWVEGTSWRGKFRTSAVQPGMAAEQLIQLEQEADPVKSPRDLLNVDDQLTPGTFWMDMDSVLQYFEYLYLNWNTGLFKFRQDLHFLWDLSDLEDSSLKRPRGSRASLQHTPQFSITGTRSEPIWILLWRHFQNSVPENATSEDIESGRHFIDLNGFINLAVFNNHGQRVILAEGHTQQGWYVDSPQTLLKLEEVKAGVSYTIVPLEDNLPSVKHSFTMSAFSQAPITLTEATTRFPYVEQIPGVWNKETAGGRAECVTHCANPQFVITVSRRTSLKILVEACNADLKVHVRLLHSGGKRVFRIQSRDIIVDSKEYRAGCCLVSREDLDPGRYTILCSTFEPQQLGDFSLRIESLTPTQTRLLPREGAGRVRTRLNTVSFTQGETTVAAALMPRRLVNLYAIAHHVNQQAASQGTGSSNTSHIRLSIEYDREPRKHVLVASNGGDYSDSASAVRTEPVDLGPDFRKYGYRDCWLVLQRMYVSRESQDEMFQVELLVDQPNAIDVGEWVAWEE